MADAASHPTAPTIRRLKILRFRGIEQLTWRPKPGLNVILGGGDAGKTTVLEAIALVLSPTNSVNISDVDFWRRVGDDGFEIEVVMSLPEQCGMQSQTKQSWPWDWNGQDPQIPILTEGGAIRLNGEPVYVLRVRASADFDVSYELVQPNGSIDFLSLAVRRAIGIVRLGGDDRNDRDLRLVQGSALDRLISDKALRARVGVAYGEAHVEAHLKGDGTQKLQVLDQAFRSKSLPADLGLGLTSGQGTSIGSLIGLTAVRPNDQVRLPLSSWGAGTRRLASLETAQACQNATPVTLVDEVERGLEPYRLRSLVAQLQRGPSQVFLTTHNAIAVSAANLASLWYLDANGTIGELPREKISRHQVRDPEALLARLTIVAEGEAEKGFVRELLQASGCDRLNDRGIWISDGQGNENCLNLIEALSSGGVSFGGFVDNEGTFSGRWKVLVDKLGPLLFRWKNGCLEENILAYVEDKHLEEFIVDPTAEHTGDRLRTLAARLGIAEKNFVAIKAATKDIRALILDAALGRIPPDKQGLSESEKKTLKSHQRCWFKSFEGGIELHEKMNKFNVWPKVKVELLPFINAIRAVESLPPLEL